MAVHQQYTQAPPSYAPPVAEGQRPKGATSESSLLGEAAGPSNHWADQPDYEDDIEDFKIGSTVSQCSLEIRQAFIRKVYSILLAQLVMTTAVSAAMKYADAQYFWMQHTWLLFVPLLGAIGSMIALFAKAEQFPVNFVLLAVFTAFESVSVGAVVSFYNTAIVLQALCITTLVFLGLTLFAMQTRYDLSSLGGWLYAALLGFFFTGLVSILLPFSNTMQIVYAGFGTLLFSGYILYDTFIITKRLSPDQYCLAAVSLYLDFVNLFLSILRLLNSIRDD